MRIFTILLIAALGAAGYGPHPRSARAEQSTRSDQHATDATIVKEAIDHAYELREQGFGFEAALTLRQVPPDWRPASKPGDSSHAEDLRRAGDLAAMRLEYSSAKNYYSDALVATEVASGRNSQEYLFTTLRLAAVYWQEPKRAEPFVTTASGLIAQVFPEPTTLKAYALTRLASLYSARQEKTKAAETFLKAFEVAKKAATTDPMEYVRIMFRVGPYVAHSMDASQAVAVTSEALSVVKLSVGETTAEYARALRYAAVATRVGANLEVQDLNKNGKYVEAQQLIADRNGAARKLLQHAVQLHETLSPRESLQASEYVEALKDLAMISFSTGNTNDRSEATALIEKALQVSQTAFHEKDPSVLMQMVLLNGVDFGASVTVLTEAAEIVKRVYGPKSPMYSTVVLQLGGACDGRYNTSHDDLDRQAAFRNYELWAEITKEIDGETSSAYAGALNTLAAYYQETDKQRAIVLTKQAEAILNRTEAVDASSLSQRLMTASNYVSSERNYSKAAVIYEEVLAKGKEAWGEGGAAQYWGAVNSLASLYVEMGEYGKASKLYEQLMQAAPGPDEQGIESAYLSESKLTWSVDLASILTKLGEYDRAENILKPLVRDPNPDDNAPMEEAALNQSLIQGALGEVYLLTGRFKEAVPCFEKPMEALKKQMPGVPIESFREFGSDRLFGLAKARQLLGERDKARELFEDVLSKDHDKPEFKLGAAEFFHTEGEFQRAEALLTDALTTIRKSFGEAHPDYAAGLMQGALMYGAWGKPEKALEYELLALTSLDEFVRQLSLWASEDRLQTYLGTVERRYDLFYSLISTYYAGEKPEARKALERHLAYKGRLVEAVATRNRLALLSREPNLGKIIEDLKDLTQQIAHLSMSPPKDMQPDKFRAFIVKLEEKRRGLEENLARGSADFAQQKSARVIKVDDFLSALPPKATYVDFVEYENYDYVKRQWTGEQRFLAFLAGRGPNGKSVVRIEDLGPAREINILVERLRRRLIEGKQTERGVGGIRTASGGAAEAGKTPARDNAREALFSRLFGPLSAYLRQTEMLVLAPSGNLNLVPFEVLEDPTRSGYLCDQFRIIYGLGRDVYTTKRPGGTGGMPRHGDMALVAAPDFTGPAGTIGVAVAYDSAKPLLRGAVRDWPATFDSLPGTLREAETVEKLAKGSSKTTTLTGEKASEAAVKSLPHPGILHLATHGFFLEDVERPTANGTRGVGGIRAEESRPLDEETAQLRNASLRSGLALAGANRLAADVPIPEGEEDGILTAAEVSGMDLHGTDLVVLSACETGLGDVQRGEGVFGLRRAFKIAGVRNIVMSLWSVPDEETVWLMEEFYKSYFAGDKPAAALNKARAATRKRLIARDGVDDPYYWAAFVLEGSDL
jgi:CHAT domain-containing protein/tetratricopeptide (TPR) repeat protein